MFRKMSFLSADGRLEDRGSRRESKESRGSLESDVSIRIAGWGMAADELKSNIKQPKWRIGEFGTEALCLSSLICISSFSCLTSLCDLIAFEVIVDLQSYGGYTYTLEGRFF